jgi:predicted aspartyl protease
MQFVRAANIMHRFLSLLPAWTIAAALSIVLCAPGRANPAPAAATDKRDQAIALYNARDYRGAAGILDVYLLANTTDYYAAYYAALAHQQLGDSGKARQYYRQVYNLAPNSKIGTYARDILLKLDPSFAASIARTTKASTAIPSTETGIVKAIVDLPPTDEAPPLDPTLPAECRVRFEKGLGTVQLDAFIDGRPLKMTLDTGASGISVGKNQLAQMGAPLPPGKADGVTDGSSISGPISFWMIKATVKVGPIERKNCDIQVLDSSSAQPLLGQTFFKGLDYTIDQGGGEVVFRQKALTAKMGEIKNSVSVPFTFKEAENRIIVQVEVNGKSGPMIFDSGSAANACLFKSTGQLDAFGLKVPDDAWLSRPVVSRNQIRGTGLHFVVKRIKLGPIDRSDIDVGVDMGSSNDENLPLLGPPFWQGYEYTIDMKKKLIHFVRR